MRFLLTAIWLLLLVPGAAQFQGLVINEFSQGDQGSREYIELLVVGRRTCTDTTADLRGWIVDDQNGWYGTASLTRGHYRFKNVAAWAAVPYGALIVLYNSAAGEKNLSITQPDDPADANHDLVYIVPINSGAYLEENDVEPSSLTGPSFVYPPATSTINYTNASNLWIQHIALTNGSDVVCTVSPQDRTTHFFAIGYGYPIAPGFRAPAVSVPAVNAGSSCFLTDSTYGNAGSWSIAPVPQKETPGLPNGGTNTRWISAMRTTPRPVRSYELTCSDGPYLFNGQTLTATGSYSVLTPRNGCVDTASVYVVIKTQETVDTAACDSLRYAGVLYTADASLTEHISSQVLACDSLVRTVQIRIRKPSTAFVTACADSGDTLVYNGASLTKTGVYPFFLTAANGCDSTVFLSAVFATKVLDTLRGCDSVWFRNAWHFADAVFRDTIKSRVCACDSIIRTTKLVVHHAWTSPTVACLPPGGRFQFFGQSLSASGTYTHTLQTTAGCDSTVILHLTIAAVQRDTLRGCEFIVYRGTTYSSSVVVQDTLRTVNGCDSVYHSVQLLVLSKAETFVNACIKTGQAYSFNGQTLNGTGHYVGRWQTLAGCDSLVHLYLVVSQVRDTAISGCGSVRFGGRTYTNSVVLSDTVRSVVSGCDSLVQQVRITVIPKPLLVVSRDTTICSGGKALLTASAPNATVAWTGFGQASTISVSPPATTLYLATATDAVGCSNSESVTVSVVDFALTLSASENPVLSGKPLVLQSAASRAYTVLQWLPANLFSNQTLKQQAITADSSAQIVVEAVSPPGCRDTAALDLAVIPFDDIFVPTAFTPNGDGKNDELKVAGASSNDFHFTIFNRWGQQVFSTTNRAHGWNGTQAGVPQPAGVYVYVLKARKANGKLVEKKGTVVLLR